MKKLILSMLVLSSSAFAASEFNLHCKAEHNGDLIMSSQVKLAQKQRNLVVGGNEQYDFILGHNGGHVVELQAYDAFEPSRSYATATLKDAGASVQLSIWKRDLLLDVNCTLL